MPVPGSCGWPGRWTRGSSQCPNELVTQGLLVSTLAGGEGEQGLLGRGREIVVKPIGNLLNGSSRAAFNHRKGEDFQPHCAACPSGPAAISPRGGLARSTQLAHRWVRGSGLLDMHSAGLGATARRLLLPGWKTGCQLLLLLGSQEGSPRTWPPAGSDCWLRFELMLLRRRQWVPSGPFRRLQIAFKPIHAGVEREISALNQPSEPRKRGKWAEAGVGTGAGGKHRQSQHQLSSHCSVTSVASPCMDLLP